MSELKVIDGQGKPPADRASCTIKIDGEVTTHNEFVVLTYDPVTGRHRMHQNCDAVTMGIAYKMTAFKFKEMYDELSPSDKAQVDSIFRLADGGQ